jgi:hypothetical protein
MGVSEEIPTISKRFPPVMLTAGIEKEVVASGIS